MQTWTTPHKKINRHNKTTACPSRFLHQQQANTGIHGMHRSLPIIDLLQFQWVFYFSTLSIDYFFFLFCQSWERMNLNVLVVGRSLTIQSLWNWSAKMVSSLTNKLRYLRVVPVKRDVRRRHLQWETRLRLSFNILICDNAK